MSFLEQVEEMVSLEPRRSQIVNEASDENFIGRLRMVEAALRDLQKRELDREDDDDEEVRLESELSPLVVHLPVTEVIYAIYDQLAALVTTVGLAGHILDDVPRNGEHGLFYDLASDFVDSVMDEAFVLKTNMGGFIVDYTPSYFQRPVVEGEEDDDDI